MCQVGLIQKFLNRIIREKRAAFSHCASFKDRENGTNNFASHLIPALNWRDDTKRYIHAGLHREQVSHSQETAINGCGVLYLESMRDCSTIKPDNVYVLDGLEGRLIVIERQCRH
jgi:hypothetical protein